MIFAYAHMIIILLLRNVFELQLDTYYSIRYLKFTFLHYANLRFESFYACDDL